MSPDGPPPPPPPPPPPRHRGSGGQGTGGPGSGGGPGGGAGSPMRLGSAPVGHRSIVAVTLALLVFALSNPAPTDGKDISYSLFLKRVTADRSRRSPTTTPRATSRASTPRTSRSTAPPTSPPRASCPSPTPTSRCSPSTASTSSPRPNRRASWPPGCPCSSSPRSSSSSSIPCSVEPRARWGNIMSIGRSRAKTYSTERPGTTFADVAGYEGVKTEIRGVVDFLKYPESSARSADPQGVLLVGPPSTGETSSPGRSPARPGCRSCR
ncbi:MAG: hypothetical protein R2711_14125 [Acidimicrobiales bacterium]